MSIQIIIADDHQIVRQGLVTLLARIIREGDEGTPSREFFEERQGKEEAEKGREEFPGSIFRQEPTGLVFQG